MRPICRLRHWQNVITDPWITWCCCCWSSSLYIHWSSNSPRLLKLLGGGTLTWQMSPLSLGRIDPSTARCSKKCVRIIIIGIEPSTAGCSKRCVRKEILSKYWKTRSFCERWWKRQEWLWSVVPLLLSGAQILRMIQLGVHKHIDIKYIDVSWEWGYFWSLVLTQGTATDRRRNGFACLWRICFLQCRSPRQVNKLSCAFKLCPVKNWTR